MAPAKTVNANEPSKRGRKPGQKGINREFMLYLVLEDYITDKAQRQACMTALKEKGIF